MNYTTGRKVAGARIKQRTDTRIYYHVRMTCVLVGMPSDSNTCGNYCILVVMLSNINSVSIGSSKNSLSGIETNGQMQLCYLIIIYRFVQKMLVQHRLLINSKEIFSYCETF